MCINSRTYISFYGVILLRYPTCLCIVRQFYDSRLYELHDYLACTYRVNCSAREERKSLKQRQTQAREIPLDDWLLSFGRELFEKKPFLIAPGNVLISRQLNLLCFHQAVTSAYSTVSCTLMKDRARWALTPGNSPTMTSSALRYWMLQDIKTSHTPIPDFGFTFSSQNKTITSAYHLFVV